MIATLVLMPSLRNDPDALNGRIFDRLHQVLATQERIEEISRVSPMSNQSFMALAAHGYPLIFNGLVPERPMKASLAVLERARDLVLELRHGNYADPGEYASERKIRMAPLGELLGTLETGDR